MNIFKTAYNLQQRLIETQPDHELARHRFMVAGDEGYQLCANGEFLIRYKISGTENQLRAYVNELEAALAQKQPTAR